MGRGRSIGCGLAACGFETDNVRPDSSIGFLSGVSDTMFSAMALPIENLQKIASGLISGDCLGDQYGLPPLPTGLDEVDRFLPEGGFPRGAIVELAVAGAAAHATSIALAACRSAQQQTRLHGEVGWCAFLDPSGSLYGPGLVEAGLDIGRILVARPPTGSLEKAALRIVESQAFSVVVVDTTSGFARAESESLAAWPRVVRRLALSLSQSSTCVILVTDLHAHRPLPLPTAVRVELKNAAPGQVQMRIAKERQGRISPRRIVSIVSSTRDAPVLAPTLSFPGSFAGKPPAASTASAAMRIDPGHIDSVQNDIVQNDIVQNDNGRVAAPVL